MRQEPRAPDVHLFVCANRRDASSPLGPGCGDAGERVYASMKSDVAERGAYRSIWVTKTHCLGACPKRGCSVAVYARHPVSAALFSEVVEDEARALLDDAVSGRIV
jgi:predicted metal-binding protein